MFKKFFFNEKMKFLLLRRFYGLLICSQTRDLKFLFQVSRHSKKFKPKTHVYFWENGIFLISLPRSLVLPKNFCPPYFAPKFNDFSQPGIPSGIIRDTPLLSPLETAILQAASSLYRGLFQLYSFLTLPFSFLAIFRRQCDFLVCKTGIISTLNTSQSCYEE